MQNESRETNKSRDKRARCPDLPPLHCRFLLSPLMTGSSHIYKLAGNITYHYINSIKQVKIWARNDSFQHTVGFKQCSVRRAELGFPRLRMRKAPDSPSSHVVDAGAQCPGKSWGFDQVPDTGAYTNTGAGPIPAHRAPIPTAPLLPPPGKGTVWV